MSHLVAISRVDMQRSRGPFVELRWPGRACGALRAPRLRMAGAHHTSSRRAGAARQFLECTVLYFTRHFALSKYFFLETCAKNRRIRVWYGARPRPPVHGLCRHPMCLALESRLPRLGSEEERASLPAWHVPAFLPLPGTQISCIPITTVPQSRDWGRASSEPHANCRGPPSSQRLTVVSA